MWYILLFIAVLVWFLYLPAWGIVSLLGIDEQDWLVRFAVVVGVGIAIFTLCALLVQVAGLGFSSLWILSILSLYGLRRRVPVSLTAVKGRHVFAVIAIVFGTIAQGSALVRGGVLRPEGLTMLAVHDTGWNMAIAQQLMQHIPPEHPAMSGEVLRNTHYFYPLLVAAVGAISGIPLYVLYFRLFPFVIAAFFGLALFSIASEYTKTRTVTMLSIILGYFSGNVAYLMILWKGQSFDWRGNTFYADQPFDQIVNPYAVFGFALFLLLGLAFHRAVGAGKTRNRWLPVLFLYAGVLYGYKAFGSVIALTGIGLTALFLTKLAPKRRTMLVAIGVLLSALPVAVYLTEAGNAGLRWIPGWLLDQMVVGEDRVYIPEIVLIKQYYHSIGNWLGLVKLYVYQLGIYLGGNYGVRLLGVLSLVLILRRQIQTGKNAALTAYLFLSMVIATAIPLLTNLQNSAHNIVQFTPYALMIAGIFTGIWCRNLRHSRFIMLLVVIAAVAVNWKNMLQTFGGSVDVVPISHLQSLEYMADDPDMGAILLYPDDFVHHPIHVAALAARALYFADEGLISQTGRNPKERIQAVNDFFAGTIDGPSFLVRERIRFVYVMRDTQRESALVQYGLRKVFETIDTVVYSL